MVNSNLRSVLLEFRRGLQLRREVNCRLDEAAKVLFEAFVQYVKERGGMNDREALDQFFTEELSLTDGYVRQFLRRKFIRLMRMKAMTNTGVFLPLESYFLK